MNRLVSLTAFLFLIWTLVGCASSKMVAYKVNSIPSGAQVDVNGTTLGQTPTEITLGCSKRWIGILYAPGGWAYDNTQYEITVYPSAQNPGHSQTKRVNPCEWRGQGIPELNFDLGLQETNPMIPVDLRVKNGQNPADFPESVPKKLKTH